MQKNWAHPSAEKLLTTTAVVLTIAFGTLRAHATDTTPPVISGVPSNVTVECSSVPAAASPTATDDTDPNPSIALQENSNQALSGCGKYSYTLVRTWVATDASGNTSSASQQITVHDTTAPTLSYIPANATVECSAIPAPPTVVTNCAAITTPPQLRLSDGTPAGTIVITDQGLNDSSGVAGQISYAGSVGTWTINITTALTAPAPGGGSSIQPTMLLNTLNIGSGQLTIEFSANGFCANGVMQAQVGGISGGSIQFKTWVDTANTNFGKQILVQNLGAFGTGSFSSNSMATISPSLPYSITLQTVINHTISTSSQFSSQVGVFVPTATDNCDSSPTITFGQSSTQAISGFGHDNYTITRTWNATDACGNTSSAQQILTVHDTTAPVITGVPANTTVQCNAVPAPATPNVADNCDASPALTLAENSTQSPTGCGHFNYTINRTWTATDATGNTSTAHQLVTVHDTSAPILSGVPANTTVECASVPAPATPSANDNCDRAPAINFTSASTQTGSGCGHFNYTLTRTWTAMDACGNSSSAQQTILVHDTTAPLLSAAPPDVTVQCDAVPSAPTLTATDNCDPSVTVVSTQTSAGGSCSGSYVLTRTWTATDACGNSNSHVQHISVIDTTAPVLAGIPADVTVQCDAVPAAASPTATDNCDASPSIILSQTTVAGSCSGNYVLTRKWTATDVCGNSSTASQQISVIDTASPVLVGVPADITVDCNAVPIVANVTATDNCDTNATVSYASFSTQTPTGLGHDTYILKRKWTVTDACGNSATAQQILTVAPIAPVITDFPPDVTYSCSSEVPAADDNLISGTDPCGGNILYIYHDGDVITNLTCANQYDIARAYHVTNVCGIITSQTQHITVRDLTAPVISAYPADATLTCMCSLPAANDGLITAADNCSSVTVTHSTDVTNNIVDSLHFDIQRTYTATDVCGNQSSHTQTFHMNLSAPPFITITGAPYIQVSNASYVVHGTAGSTFPLGGVYYSLNGGAYQLATGTSSWSAQCSPGLWDKHHYRIRHR
ncbi:MAG: hypothetical protein JWO95_126 [Verrucomicrobiales bacterium]|nr:hypothetical protein [Verrucomicrobiales bacterium]